MLTRSHRLRPRTGGVTLVEVVVSLAVLAIFATVVISSVEGSTRLGGEAKRIAEAAKVLERLRDAAVRVNLGDPAATGLTPRNILGDTSFTSKISGIASFRGGVNPGRLSYLTNKIVATDLNSCGGTFTTVVNNWTKNFFTQPIAPGGTFKIADGFVANDVMVRYNPAGVPTNLVPNTSTAGVGTLAIVIPNVALSDAKALATLMEGDQPLTLGTGNFAVVRFTEALDAPVTVFYHMAIRGC